MSGSKYDKVWLLFMKAVVKNIVIFVSVVAYVGYSEKLRSFVVFFYCRFFGSVFLSMI